MYYKITITGIAQSVITSYLGTLTIAKFHCKVVGDWTEGNSVAKMNLPLMRLQSIQ